jgi:hypothetical protein
MIAVTRSCARRSRTSGGEGHHCPGARSSKPVPGDLGSGRAAVSGPGAERPHELVGRLDWHAQRPVGQQAGEPLQVLGPRGGHNVGPTGAVARCPER